MYDYNSELSHATVPNPADFPVIFGHPRSKHYWNHYRILLWNRLTHPKARNGQHHLLPTTDSLANSTRTTATDLVSLDIQQSLESISPKNRRMMDNNLVVSQPEIEPLQIKPKETLPTGEGSINSSSYNISVYNETTVSTKPIYYRQVLTALSVSLVSLVVGFISAYTAPAKTSLDLDIDVTDNEWSWVCGFMPLGALIGGLAGGSLIETLGRKYAILATDALFIVSWLCIANATNVWYLYVGRCIAGTSVGVASLALPVYLGETIQPEIRGTLGLLPTAFGNIGILICFVAGNYMPWNYLAWLGIVFPLPFLVLAFFIPETPRWYISKGREESAHRALQWLRGTDADIQDEFTTLTAQQENDEKGSNSNIADLFSRPYLKALLISLGLMFFQQTSGINAVIMYTTEIFQMSGSSIDENICTIIVGVVNFISTFIATVLIDRLGRKVLLYVSSITMFFMLGCLGIYFYLLHVGVEVHEYGWVPLVSFVIYVLGFSLGFGPIPWLMLGEILPAKVRGSAASVATAFNWSCTFLVTKTFVDMNTLLGIHGTFLIFTMSCLISFMFVIFCVPETQGLSLQDIERKLAGLKVRRMSSVANLKPLPSTF